MGLRSTSAVARDPETTVSSSTMAKSIPTKRELKLKKASKPLGREARPGRLNRTDQVWRSEKERDEEGTIIGFHHYKCIEPGCGALVRVNADGWAECDKCGRIYNDYYAEYEYYKLIGWSRFTKSLNYDTSKDQSLQQNSFGTTAGNDDSDKPASNDGPLYTV